jgi:hypothetical protein
MEKTIHNSSFLNHSTLTTRRKKTYIGRIIGKSQKPVKLLHHYTGFMKEGLVK